MNYAECFWGWITAKPHIFICARANASKIAPVIYKPLIILLTYSTSGGGVEELGLPVVADEPPLDLPDELPEDEPLLDLLDEPPEDEPLLDLLDEPPDDEPPLDMLADPPEDEPPEEPPPLLDLFDGAEDLLDEPPEDEPPLLGLFDAPSDFGFDASDFFLAFKAAFALFDISLSFSLF